MIDQGFAADQLRMQAEHADAVARAEPGFQTAEPRLPVPDPRFHPALGVDPFAPVPATGERAMKPAGLLRGGSNPFDPQADRFKPSFDQIIDACGTREPSEVQLSMFGLEAMTSSWDGPSRAIFRQSAPEINWGLEKQKKISGGVNDSFRVTRNGKDYFRKKTTYQGMNNDIEIAALEVGDMMGATVLPVIKGRDNDMITPWVDGDTIGGVRVRAKEVLRNMSAKTRDSQVMYEFLVADTDKHGMNYRVAADADKILGIDYGAALKGDERQMFDKNAFYSLFKDTFPAQTSPLNADTVSGIIALKDKVVEHFKKSGATSHMLEGLRDRFDLLQNYVDRRSRGMIDSSYLEFEKFATSKDAYTKLPPK